MKYIDAHCHFLNDSEIKASHDAGVVASVVNSARVSDWSRIVDIVACRDDMFGAVGIHPWYISDVPTDWKTRMRAVLDAHPDLMIGETGLDKMRPDLERQAEFFLAHLQIAHDLGRAVHVHCVGAWGMMLQILQSAPKVPAIIFHGYSGAPDIMPELMRYNAYFSFGGGVLDPRHTRMCRSVIAVDITRVLVESDAPDSSFNPNKLGNIIERIAALKECDFSNVCDIIYNNTTKVLKNE